MASRRLRSKQNRTDQRAKPEAAHKGHPKPEKQVIKRLQMETAVYVAGAFATIFLGLAAFLLSFHSDFRIRSIWLLFAGLVLSSLTLCLWLHVREIKERSEPVGQASPTTPPASPAITEQRIFVDVPPEYIMKFFDEHTAVQANKLLEAYKGKWIKASGTVDQVHNHDISNLKATQVLFTLDGKSGDAISAVSGEPKWVDQVTSLRRRDKITVVGQIKSADSSALFLENAEIVD